MKNTYVFKYAPIVLGIAMLLAVMYGVVSVAKNVSYRMFYEDLVIETFAEQWELRNAK